MAVAFDHWTPVEIAVDDDRVKATCIEVPAGLVAGAKLQPAMILRHNETGATMLTGVSAASRSPGEDAVYVSTAILTTLDPNADPSEPTPAHVRRARWTDDLVFRKGLAATVSREMLGGAALVLAAVAAFVVTHVPQELAIALLAVAILAALAKAIHEIRKQLKVDC
jgi:hypothetical protein